MEETEFPTFTKWLDAFARPLRWKARHQRFLLRQLRRVTSGKCRRLMIFMPPRHTKSETVTVRYAAWRLERDQKMNIIIASYNQKLANRFSRRVRSIVAERHKLDEGRRAVDDWGLPSGGGVKAVGVGAGVTGFGADLAIIDDPVKSRAEAESRTRRDNAWEWFTNDVITRLEPKAAVILIQTRWHEDDLAGRLLKRHNETGEKWDIVKLPALAETDDQLNRAEGEALWPERFDSKALNSLRDQMGSYAFSSLYQQSPMPQDGSLFKRSYFTRIVERPPSGLNWVRGYDLAVSTRTTADHTASFRCAFGPNGDLYIADGFRRRIEYPEQKKYMLERIRAEANTIHGIESSLHGLAAVQELCRDNRAIGRPVAAVRADRDKFTRALGWAPLAEAGKVVLVQGSWIDDFISEACSFPGGEHDDQIDAVSLAVSLLAKRNSRLHFFD